MAYLYRVVFNLFSLLIISHAPFAQSSEHSYPVNYFRNPLNIPIQLSSNFGELRNDHFHMGLDIRTGGKENMPVFAIADGYVSRVKILEKDFGKAIYITHPNGYVSLYAHLNTFYDTLENYIHQKQYADKSWEQDVMLSPGMFPVVQGQFIAYSGNTGASQAPHLHFELREEETENNLNPELFGFGIPDNISPSIYNLYWYDRRYSTYQSAPKAIAVKGKSGSYTSLNKIVKVNSPLISFGIRAEDKSSNSPFFYGIYQAEVLYDDSLIHGFTLNNFSYDDTRYVNACFDYATWKISGRYIQHLATLPGNYLPIFKNESKGLIFLNDTLPHRVSISIRDVAGNMSNLSFLIQLDELAQTPVADFNKGKILLPGEKNIVSEDNIRFLFSEYTFYDVASFQLNEKPAAGVNKASSFFSLSNAIFPVHDSITIQIKTTLAPNDSLRTRTVMQLVNDNKKVTEKGEWHGDWLSAKFDKLGNVQLFIDTIAPAIQLLGWKDGQKFSAVAKYLRLLCSDNLDKIKEFRAELDGQWLLFERKRDYFTYRFDEHCTPGTHQLNVTATDFAGNTKQQSFSFVKE